MRWSRRGAGHAWEWWWGQRKGEGEEEEEREGAAGVLGGPWVEPSAVLWAKEDASVRDWEILLPALTVGGKASPLGTGGTKELPDPWLASRRASSCLDALLGEVASSGARAVFESGWQCVG